MIIKKASNNKKVKSEISEYVSEYRERGLNLVPLKFRDKVPVVKWDEFQRRLITEEEIRKYWNGEIKHNIGIVCGAISGNLAVIDFDTREAFYKFFGENNNSIYTVKAGRGVHVYFRTKRPVKTLKILNGEGREEIILKGEGSYVVAPPSVHPSGAQYEILNKIPIPQRDEEDFREFFRELAEKKGYKVRGQREVIVIEEILKGVNEGHRDNSLLYLLTFLRRAGLEEQRAFELAKQWNQRNHPPLPISDVEYKLRYVYSHEPYRYRFSLNPKTVTISDDLEIRDISNSITYDEITRGTSGVTETRKIKDGEIIEIPGENDYVFLGKNVVQYVYVNENGKKVTETPKSVISGFFRINKRYDIDGFTYFDVSTERRLKVVSMDSLLKLLKSEGKVLKGRMLSDVVGIIASSVKEVEQGHSTIGIYEKEGNGELEVCLTPIPVTDEQQIVQLELKDAISYRATKEDIEIYISYMEFFHPYEVLPVLGLAVMSPFSLIIKSFHIILPILYLWGKHRNIGKSKTVQVFTEGFYGLGMASADRLLSEFRFNEIMNSACLPKGFDEGEKINFDKMVVIREACENQMISSRGRPDLTQVRYYSRLTPFFTGNDVKAKRPETLKRMFIVHFDEYRANTKEYEANAKKLEDLINSLNPVGFELMKFVCNSVKTKENLYNLIRKTRDLLLKVYRFEDVTKSWSWGTCYLGLVLWRRFCKKYGVDWKLPTPAEFAEKVIKNIESSTWEEVEEIATAFRDWFDGWLENKREKTGLAEHGFVENNKGGMVSGYWITNTVLQEYKKDAKGKDMPPISNLKRLAESISQTFDIPIERIAGEKGGKVCWIKGKSRVATFIPTEDKELKGTESNGSGSGGSRK